MNHNVLWVYANKCVLHLYTDKNTPMNSSVLFPFNRTVKIVSFREVKMNNMVLQTLLNSDKNAYIILRVQFVSSYSAK